jgi:hypothetical protein
MLECVDWFNHRRLFEPIGNAPPAEKKDDYYYRQLESAMVPDSQPGVSGSPGPVQCHVAS